MKNTFFLYSILLCLLVHLKVEAQVSPEICGNSIDDDSDGLVDCFDRDCCDAIPCESFYFDACPEEECLFQGSFNFDIERKAINNNLYQAAGQILAGDVDYDGSVDIVALNEDTDVELVTANNSIIIHNTDRGRYVSFAIGDIITENASAEIIVAGSSIYCYDALGNELWNNPRIPEGLKFLGLADFDQNGQAEVYGENYIFNGQTGEIIIKEETLDQVYPTSLIGSGIAIDILPTGACDNCQGLEYVFGPHIFSIDIATKVANIESSNENMDPLETYSAVVDWDLDGILDVVSRDLDKIEIWRADGSVISRIDRPTLGFPIIGLINIGNLDSDPDPELSFIEENNMVALDNDLSAIWNARVDDPSAITGMTLFDFNNDGINEICYRDEQNLRIINSLTGANIKLLPCRSGTGAEYPIIVDIDNDNEAEILIGCANLSISNGNIFSYSSSKGSPWAPCRPVWNQFNYFNVHINDDLSIPVQQQNPHITKQGEQLNSFLNQYKTPSTIDIDLKVDFTNSNSDCNQVSLSVCNLGTATFDKDLQVSLYDGNPQAGFAEVIQTLTASSVSLIEPDSCIMVTFNWNPTEFESGVVVGIINDNGIAQTPLNLSFDFPTTSILECQYHNNTFPINIAPCLQTEICRNGIDDDGDGLIDVFDPDCNCSENEWDPMVAVSWEWQNYCESILRTSYFDLSDSLNFEWYLDSIPYGDSSRLITDNFDHLIHLLIYNENGCQLIDVSDPIGLDPIGQTTEVFDSIYLCPFSTFEFGSILISSEGNYRDTFETSFACDSIVNLNVQEIVTIRVMNDLSVCKGDTVLFGGEILLEPGIYSDTSMSSIGCDSITSLVVSHIDYPSSTTSLSICRGDSVQFGSRFYYTSGIYENRISSNSCDSLAYLELTVFNSSIDTIELGLCPGENIEIDGLIIDFPQQFEVNYNVEGNCDSTVFYDISVITNVRDTVFASICESETYFFNNEDVSEAGFYQDTIIRNQDCDSIIMLVLDIQTELRYDTMIQKCVSDSFMFNDSLIEKSGQYQFNLLSTFNCDSIINLTVENYPIFQDTLQVEIDHGERFIISELAFTEEGTHEIFDFTSFGCDSIIILQVEIKNVFNLFIPNVFYPNSQSANRQFAIESDQELLIDMMKIYDRWGNIVYQTPTSIGIQEMIPWDGTVNEQKVESGVYIYHIQVSSIDNRSEKFVGDLLLIR